MLLIVAVEEEFVVKRAPLPRQFVIGRPASFIFAVKGGGSSLCGRHCHNNGLGGRDDAYDSAIK
jgi:hypothetical protein